MKVSHKPDSYSLVRLLIESDGEYTISVSQKDQRCCLRDSGYEYSYCRIILVKIDVEKTDADNDGDNLEIDYIKGDASWNRDTHLEISNLKKGEYYVYVEMDWDKNTNDIDFTVTCYGSSKSNFTRDEKSSYKKELVL